MGKGFGSEQGWGWEGDQKQKPPSATGEMGSMRLVLPQNEDERLSRGGWGPLGLCGYEVWDFAGELRWITVGFGVELVKTGFRVFLSRHLTMAGYVWRPW